MTDSELILIRDNGKILSLLITEGILREVNAYPDAEREASRKELPLGSIHVGKVTNVLKNINAAFVEVTGHQKVFLPLARFCPQSLLNRKADGRVLPGDELLIQIEKEAVKTKDPVATTELSFSGRYLVAFPTACSSGGAGRLQFSAKLSDAARKALAAYIHSRPELLSCLERYTFILRTNAGELEDYGPIAAEAARLCALADRVLSHAGDRTCYSCLYDPESPWLTEIRDTYRDQFAQILTDEQDLYQRLRDYLASRYPEELDRLRFYQDDRISLRELYSIRSKLREATESRVWLRSGGYLVIEPTEALTVIDVNSGRYSGKKGTRDTFRLLNREAAREIARQLRLRNLSGIILADFINMDEKDDERELLEYLAQELKKDPVRTTVVDMTPLGLVEITRKKVRRSLREQMDMGQ